ncbi:hypothetical protein KSF_068720 [Reticulibacter mediterranei]|uniref:Uncharacterized protein n=1 Tax=Reticulibacter mediterranei TaxID=2778369 RepID=A0A8J3IJQ9_9CHLR|nr:hypothetical protein KSF_068720 [Reticulibacter mediterranei]
MVRSEAIDRVGSASQAASTTQSITPLRKFPGLVRKNSASIIADHDIGLNDNSSIFEEERIVDPDFAGGAQIADHIPVQG